MKKKSLYSTIIFMALTVLMGCTPSYESFNLTRVEQDLSDNTHPYLFVVAPKKERNKVKLYYHCAAEAFGGFKEVKQKIKEVTITDSEMIIETTEEKFIFEKRTESLAIDENKIWYDIDYEKNYPK